MKQMNQPQMNQMKKRKMCGWDDNTLDLVINTLIKILHEVALSVYPA